MNDEITKMYNTLRAEGYPIMLSKTQYGELMNISKSKLDYNLKLNINLPPYHRMGAAKNAQLLFSLSEVCEFIVSKKVKPKKRWIALDADPLLFEICEGKFTKMKMFGAEEGSIDSDYEEPLTPYIAKFKELVKDIADEVGNIAGTKVILSDPNSCFRYDIYPTYKGNRDADARSPLFYRLRDWALKEYGYVENVEADDVVSYFVREKNYIGATMDKDMLRGVAGSWFDTYHSRRTLSELSVDEANKFNLVQTLIGDVTDNIKALPKRAGDPMVPVDDLPKGQRQPFKLTEPMAIKLLDEFGWDWAGVVKIYESKGFTEKEATLNRQLICLNQWSPEEGVVLWEPL